MRTINKQTEITLQNIGTYVSCIAECLYWCIYFLCLQIEKAIVYCDENESLYKIKVYKNKSSNDWKNYNLEIPNIDLQEPLSKMVKYIFYSIKNNTNKLFNNNLNEKITFLLI